MRVALACPGIGLVQRGFERFFMDIFRLVGTDLELTLFKGGGPETEHEKVLRFIPRGGRMVRLLPVHLLFGRTPLHTECLTFALALLPHLRGGAFDVVHTIDPPLTRVLYINAALVELTGLKYTVMRSADPPFMATTVGVAAKPAAVPSVVVEPTALQ